VTIGSELKNITYALRARTKRGRDEDQLGVRQREYETLVGFMDWFRAVAKNKVHDLSLEDASRVMTPSGLSPLGIVKHLAWCEHGWWRDIFAGEEEGWKDDDETDAFRIDPSDTVESVIADYDVQCEHARRIAGDGNLDKLSVASTGMRGRVSMRWLLLHMIEETARHCGHLDLMREQIDGRTGD
jgi:hypothetical protein